MFLKGLDSTQMVLGLWLLKKWFISMVSDLIINILLVWIEPQYLEGKIFWLQILFYFIQNQPKVHRNHVPDITLSSVKKKNKYIFLRYLKTDAIYTQSKRPVYVSYNKIFYLHPLIHHQYVESVRLIIFINKIEGSIKFCVINRLWLLHLPLKMSEWKYTYTYLTAK